MSITGKSILYDERNEHVLRRLGGAVIVHWDNLPADVQDCLLDQAALMDDRMERDNVKKDIETFLRKARVSEHKPKDAAAD